MPKREVGARLAAANAFYMPLKGSKVFTLGISPNKLFDYMAAARPIVFAVDTPSNPVAECNGGITIAPEDPAALLAATAKLKSSGRVAPCHGRARARLRHCQPQRRTRVGRPPRRRADACARPRGASFPGKRMAPTRSARVCAPPRAEYCRGAGRCNSGRHPQRPPSRSISNSRSRSRVEGQRRPSDGTHGPNRLPVTPGRPWHPSVFPVTFCLDLTTCCLIWRFRPEATAEIEPNRYRGGCQRPAGCVLSGRIVLSRDDTSQLGAPHGQA